MGMMQNVMTLTDAAANQVKSLMALAKRGEGEVLGLRSAWKRAAVQA